MRLPLSWLGELVEIPWTPQRLAQRLTLAGFEVESISTAGPAFEGVVVARVLSADPHPSVKRLRVCRVATRTGEGGEELQIVCGAPNARPGLVTALARAGACLPGEVHISATTLHGVRSGGMLCSASELGLATSSDGILELPTDTPLGVDLRVALDLDESIFEISVTPNRGDALSVLGLAREVAALSELPGPPRPSGSGVALALGTAPPGQSGLAAVAVNLESQAGAGRFLARTFHGLDNSGQSPLWMRERLRRAGLRPISPVVDITNYLMHELGQPMHAYDLAQLRGGLQARRARPGEPLQLLGGAQVQLDGQVLVIADEAGPVGMAGIMGGERTAVRNGTQDIALEVAWFDPVAIAGRARRYGLQTDASQRFERGVDPRGQERALERATELILEICGGACGPVTMAELPGELPDPQPVSLRADAVARLLGITIEEAEIERRLQVLAMHVNRSGPGRWSVLAPSWRFDIAIEADLVEEVARLGGLDAIIESEPHVALTPRQPDSRTVDEHTVTRTLAARGYQEIVTFGFVDPKLQQRLFGEQPALALANPIAADLAVLRVSLWPGLIGTARENLRRQQDRVRLFEIARRFLVEPTGQTPRTEERKSLAALACGPRWPEQWGAQATIREDFYDLKSDLHCVLGLTGTPTETFTFQPADPGSPGAAALHPQRSAQVVRQGQVVGLIGELHPVLVRELELAEAPVLFELDYVSALALSGPEYEPVSRFPLIRRDLSFTVPRELSFALIRERVSVAASGLLKELRIFDVYEGKGVESDRKSVALGLIFQDLGRTLIDQDVERLIQAVVADLQANLDARIRE